MYYVFDYQNLSHQNLTGAFAPFARYWIYSMHKTRDPSITKTVWGVLKQTSRAGGQGKKASTKLITIEPEPRSLM